MNLEIIKDRINLLEDKTQNNIIYHYQEYLMVDVVGQEELETTFNDDDWQMYSEDLTTEVKDIIDELLTQTGLIHSEHVGYDYDRKSKINKLLKRAVTCKYNIDYILVTPIYKKKSQKSVSYCIPPMQISNSYKNKSKIIEKIFYFLYENDRIINCKKEEFLAIFQPQENPTFIQWNKDAIDFVAFINALLDKVILVPIPFKGKHWVYFSCIFLSQDGLMFNTGTLRNRANALSFDDKKAFYKDNLIPLIHEVSNNG